MSPEQVYTLIAAVLGFAGSLILGWQTNGLFKEIALAIKAIETNAISTSELLVGSSKRIPIFIGLPERIKKVERTDWLLTGFAALALSAFFWGMTVFV